MIEPGLAGIESNLDRNALRYPGKVAGHVAGRQDGELGAARRRQALDAADEGHTRDAFDRDADALADAQSRDLCFLEIGDNPEIVGHDGDQKRTGAHILTHPRVPLADPAVRRVRTTVFSSSISAKRNAARAASMSA